MVTRPLLNTRSTNNSASCRVKRDPIQTANPCGVSTQRRDTQYTCSVFLIYANRFSLLRADWSEPFWGFPVCVKITQSVIDCSIQLTEKYMRCPTCFQSNASSCQLLRWCGMSKHEEHRQRSFFFLQIHAWL